jgi:hypothetical protein
MGEVYGARNSKLKREVARSSGENWIAARAGRRSKRRGDRAIRWIGDKKKAGGNLNSAAYGPISLKVFYLHMRFGVTPPSGA